MPDESPIDLDAHAAMIAYAVEGRESYPESQTRREARIAYTKNYIADVHRFLDDLRNALST